MNTTTLVSRVRDAARTFLRGSGDMQTSRTAGLAHENLAPSRLTPKKLARTLADADNGDITAQHQLFADVEDTDEHIFAELSKRRRALLSLDWDILPPPVADRTRQRKAEEAAVTVRELFDSIPDFEDLLLDMGSAIGHGFAALEVEWGYDGVYHVPLALHFRPQHWFCLDETRSGLLLRAGAGYGPSEGFPSGGQPLAPLGWVIHQHRGKSGWFARHGLFRVLMTTYLLKHYARTGFAEFLEIHGLPLRLGKFPNWATDTEKDALLRGLRALGRDAAAIIPEGMEVTFIEAVKASEMPLTAMIEHCERGASKAILGGTLTSQADGKSSTNALGSVHNEVRRDLLISDAVQMAGTITRQILLPLAVLNCGLEDPKLAPWFRFDTSEPADLRDMAEALPKLSSVMRIPAAWAHERCRIPMAREGEEVLG